VSKKQSRATKQANAQRAAERAAAIRREQERKERRRRTIVISSVVVGVLAVVLAVTAFVQFTRDDAGGEAGQVASAPRGAVDEYAVPLGPDDAEVTVEVYEDFICPFCRQFELSAGNTLKEYALSGDVQVQFKPVSFFDGQSEGTEYSTRALNALAVVLDTTGDEAAIEMHDLLFANQPAEGTPGLTDDQLIELAVTRAEASRSAVEDPIRDRKFEQWVSEATDAASKAGVNSTPTVLIEGEVLEDPSVESLREAVDAALSE